MGTEQKCNIQEGKKVPIFMNGLSCEGLRFLQVLNNTEQEKFRTSAGLFEVLNEKCRLLHNETILSL